MSGRPNRPRRPKAGSGAGRTKRAPNGQGDLDRLYRVIASRKKADPDVSYTASLLRKGRRHLAKKLGEEAVETVIAALDRKPHAVASESADLLYHLLVLWAHVGVKPEHVWRELSRREGTSGIAEKRARRRA